MAPARRPSQIDEISETLGRLDGKLDALDRYTHEREHGINNLSQKFDALGTRITRDIAAVEERIKVRFEAIESRLAVLESDRAADARVRSVWLEILKSPIVAGIIGGVMSALALAWAFLSGGGHAR